MSVERRKAILDEASSLVNGDRNETYGDPYDDYMKVSKMWNAYLEGLMKRRGINVSPALTDLIEPHDAIAMMVLLKTARIANAPGHRDNWVDLAGYAACGWDAFGGPSAQSRAADSAEPPRGSRNPYDIREAAAAWLKENEPS